MNLASDWDSLVTGSLDVSIKSVVASPSFLSADSGYGYYTAPSCKTLSLGRKLCISGCQHKLGTITMVLRQESTCGAVDQGILLGCLIGIMRD
jgi:hypothetical protein